MLIVVSALVGGVLALLLEPTISAEQARYLAVAVIAAVDAALGGVRAHLEKTFSDRVFVVAFVANASAAAAFVWFGDQLGVDLVTAVAVVFGVRIFQNLAAIRRRVFGG